MIFPSSPFRLNTLSPAKSPSLNPSVYRNSPWLSNWTLLWVFESSLLGRLESLLPTQVHEGLQKNLKQSVQSCSNGLLWSCLKSNLRNGYPLILFDRQLRFNLLTKITGVSNDTRVSRKFGNGRDA